MKPFNLGMMLTTAEYASSAEYVFSTGEYDFTKPPAAPPAKKKTSLVRVIDIARIVRPVKLEDET